MQTSNSVQGTDARSELFRVSVRAITIVAYVMLAFAVMYGMLYSASLIW